MRRRPASLLLGLPVLALLSVSPTEARNAEQDQQTVSRSAQPDAEQPQQLRDPAEVDQDQQFASSQDLAQVSDQDQQPPDSQGPSEANATPQLTANPGQPTAEDQTTSASPDADGTSQPAADADQPQFSDKDQQKLLKGETVVHSSAVPGSKLPMLTATAIFDVPPAQIWPYIDRCGDYVNTMVRISASEELERTGTRVLCKSTVNLPFPLGDLTSTLDAQHLVQPGLRYERRWKLHEGPYKINSGRWVLTPYDEAGTKTLVLYEMHAEPNISLPNWVQKIGARKSIPDLFDKLREESSTP